MRRFRYLSPRATALCVVYSAAVLLSAAVPAKAGPTPTFTVSNLITNNPTDNPGKITDPNLINPWGVSFGGTTPLWVSNEGTNVASVYSISNKNDVSIVAAPFFPVQIPGGAPTGQNFNTGAASGAFNGDAFLFVTLNGAVAGWRPSLGNQAETIVAGSAANSYDGSTLVTVNNSTYLLAANAKSGNIDVFSGTANQPHLGTFSPTPTSLPALFPTTFKS